MALTKITNSLVAVNAIQGTLIADNAVTAVHIVNNAVTATQLADNAVTATKIQNGIIATDHLTADLITAAKIADDAISEEHLDVTVISSLSAVTANSSDYVMIGDASDSNALKKALVSDFGGSGATLSGSTNNTVVTVTGSNAMIGESTLTYDGLHLGMTSNHADHPSDANVIQVGGNAAIQGKTATGAGKSFRIMQNVYDDAAAGLSYISTDEASHYTQVNGTHSFNVAASGSADAAITFTEAMHIDSAGNVGIGTSSPDPATGQTQRVLDIRGGSDNNFGGTLRLASLNGSSYSFSMRQVQGSLRFENTYSDTERMRIQANGGISFNGDSAAANALDDYEEGTFTPSSLSIAGGSGSVAMDSSNDLLAYTKIGNRVWIQGTIKISSNSANGGRINLNGLPFTSAAGTELSGRSIFHAQVTEGSGSQDSGFFAVVEASSTLMQIKTYTGEGITNDSAVIMVANSHLYLSGSYMTA